jgi:hypothetical protein
MPALKNPRHEAFAQAIFAGLSRHQNYSKAQAYRDAGYKASMESSRRCASRLLTFVDGVAERIHELQAEQLARITPKLDLSKERIGRNLDYATQLAKRQDNATAIVNSELAIAKVFHSVDAPDPNAIDFKSAQSMHDIGKRLLQSMGLREPDDVSIQLAIEANDAFVDRLKAISEAAQGLG